MQLEPGLQFAWLHCIRLASAGACRNDDLSEVDSRALVASVAVLSVVIPVLTCLHECAYYCWYNSTPSASDGDTPSVHASAGPAPPSFPARVYLDLERHQTTASTLSQSASPVHTAGSPYFTDAAQAKDEDDANAPLTDSARNMPEAAQLAQPKQLSCVERMRHRYFGTSTSVVLLLSPVLGSLLFPEGDQGYPEERDGQFWCVSLCTVFVSSLHTEILEPDRILGFLAFSTTGCPMHAQHCVYSQCCV